MKTPPEKWLIVAILVCAYALAMWAGLETMT